MYSRKAESKKELTGGRRRVRVREGQKLKPAGKQTFNNKHLRDLLTSFLSNGVKNGSLTLRPATTVNIGSRQLNMAPKISIFPSFGSTGSIDKWRPAKCIEYMLQLIHHFDKLQHQLLKSY